MLLQVGSEQFALVQAVTGLKRVLLRAVALPANLQSNSSLEK